MADGQEVGVSVKTWPRPATPYEEFSAGQGVPIYRGMIGVRDVRELELGPWDRTGGRGAFIDLDGTGGLLGMYLVEVPPGGALNPERHLYEEVHYVLDGRGTTEVWIEDDGRRQSFEWATGSLFSPPLNTWHRLVNGSSSPALVLVGTNAPPIMEMFRNQEFIFETPYHFRDRYDLAEAFFTPWERPETDIRGRAINRGAHIPDIVSTPLPLDGQRGPGHRYFSFKLAGNFFRGHIAEYPSGRYSKTHAHEAGPVIVCLSGQGYTLTWPKSAGTTPWANGNGDQVVRADYVAGGVMSAAPGGADWFHGHYGTSREPLRVMALLGGYPKRTEGPPGARLVHMNQDIKKGGNTIEFRDEDPTVLETFREELAKNGAVLDMDPRLFE